MLTHRANTILGETPIDWSRDLLKNLLTGQQGGDWGADEGEIPIRVIRSTNFTEKGTLDFDDVAVRYFSASKTEKMVLERNDLLLERSGGGLNQPVGRIGFISDDLPGHWFSNFVQLLRPDADKVDPEFLGWVLLELNRSGVVERLQHQTTQMRNLDFRDYLRVFLPIPPPDEQRAIAHALQSANEAIVASRRKLIAARRLKTALMQQLITCGVPGRHTRFRETKIGQLPEEWTTEPLGGLAFIVSGIALNTDREAKQHPHKYLTVFHVQRERLDLSDVRYMEVFPDELPNALLEEGDLLVVEGHANSAEIGRAALATSEVAGCAFQNHIFRVRVKPDSEMDNLFVLGVLNSERVRRHWVATCNTSSGLNTINRRGLRRLLIQRPKPGEQKDIAALLSTANRNIKACEEEIKTVDRLKRSLLQNLITGKIRVRI